MELTREIYWNVGRGVLLPMYLLAAAAIGVLGYGFWQRVRVYRLGKPLNRNDDPGSRICGFLKDVLLQGQVLRVKGPGLLHSLFFWGFVLLFGGTILVFIQADITDPLFGWRFLTGSFYLIFSLTLDLAGLMAIAMLGVLLMRRFVVRPEGLPNTWDNAFMLILLAVILISGFVLEGSRMAVTEVPGHVELAAWSPVGLLVARSLAGMSEAALRTLHTVTWWGHFALVMGFIVSIPFTKFRHIFTTSANTLFADRRPKGGIDLLDLEDEAAESFGVATIGDFTWKDLFDADACTFCKRCQDRCPAWATDKPLSPMKMVNQIQDVAFGKPEADLIDTVTRDVLWACTTCRACQEICPAAIEHVNKILEMRRHLVLMEGEFPGEEVRTAADHIEINGNPLGMTYASRGDWAQELGVQSLAAGAEIDLLYFVGCYASFDQRNIRVARSFIRICQSAGIKVGILGNEEKCCGEPMRKLGNEYLFQALARENIETIKSYGVRQIVTTCPHCLNTLGRDYRELGLEIPVEHYTVFLERLLREDRLHLQPGEFHCTYHDSCYIGRYTDIFEQPRALIQAVGGTIHEMDKNRLESFCCGGGGGRVLAEEKIGTRISESRAKMAAATEADLLLSNCPYCLTMFEDGIKGAGLEGQLVPKDLAEMIAERLKNT